MRSTANHCHHRPKRTIPSVKGTDSAPQSNLDLLVEVLYEGLHMLVREGLITDGRARERARNQAQSLICYFEFEEIEDEQEAVA